ncbi:MAG: hypothetical protein AAGJ70_12260 [Pseudomonadota bacterium]
MFAFKTLAAVGALTLVFTAPAPTFTGAFAAEASTTSALTPASLRYATKQFAGEQLVSRVMGATVHNVADETVCEINDLVCSCAGQIDLVVIGVGGCLGLGEKDVAVRYTALGFETDAKGARVAVANVTRQGLEDAVAYKTTDGFPAGTSGKLQKRATRLGEDAKTTFDKASETTKSAWERARDSASKAYNQVRQKLTENSNTQKLNADTETGTSTTQ